MISSRSPVARDWSELFITGEAGDDAAAGGAEDGQGADGEGGRDRRKETEQHAIL